jgi:hypothetical protein
MFFNDAFSLLRVVIVGTLAYWFFGVAIACFRQAHVIENECFRLGSDRGDRLHVGDGSALKNVALADGVVAFTQLIGLQYVITWLSVRSRRVENLIKAEPSLLYFNGRFLHQALKNERVTEAEVRAAVRSQGSSEMENVAAVVLETDGSLTVLRNQDDQVFTSLKGIKHPVL